MKNAEQVLQHMVQGMPYKLANEYKPYILEAMRVFANLSCIEQRKLCLENVLGMDANLEYMQDYILEAMLAVQP